MARLTGLHTSTARGRARRARLRRSSPRPARSAKQGGSRTSSRRSDTTDELVAIYGELLDLRLRRVEKGQPRRRRRSSGSGRADKVSLPQIERLLAEIARDRPPYLSAAEYIALRDRFGITATEADHVLPAWEVDMLLDAIDRRPRRDPRAAEHPGRSAAAGGRADPFARPPPP
jgi:hypothetical protein